MVGSWDQWAIHVIETLSSCEKSNKAVADNIQLLRQDFLVHKTKVETRAAIIGSISGFLVSVVVAIAMIILKNS